MGIFQNTSYKAIVDDPLISNNIFNIPCNDYGIFLKNIKYGKLLRLLILKILK
ncbi:hypothetical protein HMPREF0454_04602 [Hafnia alvei ATCC 51873]|uniref:Uncharacterized protein n=1 Tax=Hafnia alvei ATCC 51873 TaxID=1002364 RepID=G9YD91_HAFAL|nr:hypothetical protein HMPREF0454_04602 [Hafnia alvei ATCC 51873]